MNKDIKEKLKGLSKDELEDLLIDIANRSDVGLDKINRTVSNANQNLKTYRIRLNDLKNYRGYIDWRGNSSFSYELTDLLEYIPKSITSPDQGLELVIEFIKADEHIFEMADDSSGCIGGVFRSEVCELFIEYAKEYSDRDKLIKIVRELSDEDGYGARDFIITEAGKYLSNSELRILFDSYKNKSKNSERSYGSSWIIEKVAAQLKDAPLFEKLIRNTNDKLEDRHYLSIAKNYYDCEDYKTAQKFVNKISKGDCFLSSERDNLQKDIYRKTKETDKLEKILRRDFKKYYSKYSLEELLDVIGKEHKKEICSDAIKDIMNKKKFNESDADFLIYCHSYDELDSYVLKHTDALDGDHYYSLLSIGEVLRSKKKFLSATLIYRALIDSILRRAKSKTYHHGIDYLKILDAIENKVISWEGHLSHQSYFQKIKEAHKRKYSFWNRYSGDY